MKKFLLLLLSMFCFCTLAFAEDSDTSIEGFWKVIDDKTGRPDCVVAIYEYQGKWYGRMIGSYNENGVMKDTIYKPVDRAPGIVGNPYYSGIELIYNLRQEEDDDSKYKGHIVDPKKGKVYKCEIWREGDNLIVRGELWVFGRNIVWPRATPSDFPPNFKLPDAKKFVPVIPQVQ